MKCKFCPKYFIASPDDLVAYTFHLIIKHGELNN